MAQCDRPSQALMGSGARRLSNYENADVRAAIPDA
jgi:hypothetical protein